jgi:hypothetical protein
MPTPQPLSVHFEAADLGLDTDRIIDWSIDSDYLTSTDGFSFTLLDPDITDTHRLEMQPVELLLDGNQQLLGRIDVTECGANGDAVVCRGRDYLADLVECSLDPSLAIKEAMTLGDAVKQAACIVGINTILGAEDLKLRNVRTGRSTRGGKAPKDFRAIPLTDLKPDSSMGLFDWLNRLVSRHSATMQPATKRNELLLEEPNYDQEPIGKIRRSRDVARSASNNVIDGVAACDFSSFPTHTVFRSKSGGGSSGLAATESKLDIGDIVAAIGGDLEKVVKFSAVVGRRIPKPASSLPLVIGQIYRLLYQLDTDSKTQEQLERVARRALGERLKETLVYSCTLIGHKDLSTGAYWATNTVVDVQDDLARVHEPLWVASRQFSYAPPRTKLKCWRKGAFIV